MTAELSHSSSRLPTAMRRSRTRLLLRGQRSCVCFKTASTRNRRQSRSEASLSRSLSVFFYVSNVQARRGKADEMLPGRPEIVACRRAATLTDGPCMEVLEKRTGKKKTAHTPFFPPRSSPTAVKSVAGLRF